MIDKFDYRINSKSLTTGGLFRGAYATICRGDPDRLCLIHEYRRLIVVRHKISPQPVVRHQLKKTWVLCHNSSCGRRPQLNRYLVHGQSPFEVNDLYTPDSELLTARSFIGRETGVQHLL